MLASEDYQMSKHANVLSNLGMLFSVLQIPVIVAVPEAMVSQTAVPTGQNSAGLAILGNSLSAMGGQALWSQISDSTVLGTCTPTPLQNGTAPPANPIRWITDQDQFRYESSPGGQVSALLSGHGKPAIAGPTGTQPLTFETATLSKPFHLPGLVFSTILSDSLYQVIVVGNETVQGKATTHLKITRLLSGSVEAGSTQDWWLDASSFLPALVTYSVPGQGIKSYLPVTYAFTGWSADTGGLVIPHQIAESMSPGISLQTCSVLQLNINTQPAPSLFDSL
jgi:hypothetical protein